MQLISQNYPFLIFCLQISLDIQMNSRHGPDKCDISLFVSVFFCMWLKVFCTYLGSLA
jgi:hypothetical protein